MPDPSAGEVSGWLGWLLGLASLIGGTIAWLAGREDRRKSIREEKLTTWQAELERREQQIDDKQREYYSKLEEKLAEVLEQNAALVKAYQLIVSALHIENPTNPAIGQADELLKSVFPIDPTLPPQMIGLLKQIPGDRGPTPES